MRVGCGRGAGEVRARRARAPRRQADGLTESHHDVLHSGVHLEYFGELGHLFQLGVIQSNAGRPVCGSFVGCLVGYLGFVRCFVRSIVRCTVRCFVRCYVAPSVVPCRELE